jgi:hypothetical protein
VESGSSILIKEGSTVDSFAKVAASLDMKLDFIILPLSLPRFASVRLAEMTHVLKHSRAGW